MTFMQHSSGEKNQHSRMDEWKNKLLQVDLKKIFCHAWEGKKENR